MKLGDFEDWKEILGTVKDLGFGDLLCPMDINPTLRNFKCLQLKKKVHDRIRTRVSKSEGQRFTDVLSRLS